MSTSFNTKHYTYHIGTSAELNSSKTLCYFLSNDLPGSLTLSGLSRYYSEVLFENPLVRWTTQEPEGYFLMKGSFDTIIYLAPSGKPVGYTIFSEPQSDSTNNIEVSRMTLRFHFNIENHQVEFSATQSLAPIWSLTDPVFPEKYHVTGDKPEIQGYRRYTNRISQVSEGLWCVTDTATLVGENNYGFWYTPIELSGVKKFSNYTIGTLSGTPVIYRWSESGDYSIDCLFEYNHFGVHKNIKKGKVQGSIIGAIGQVLQLTTGYYDTATGTQVNLPDETILLGDRTSEDNGLEIFDLTSDVYDYREYPVVPGRYYQPVRTDSGWLVSRNSKVSKEAWSNLYGTVYLTPSITTLPISPRLLLSVTPETLDFYMLKPGEELLEPSRSIKYQYQNEPGDTESPEKSVRELIDGLRNRPLPKGTSLEFLKSKPVAYRGLIFWLDKETNKINLL